MLVNKQQLAAILKMAQAMARADGIVLEDELDVLLNELKYFGVPNAQVPYIIAGSEDLDYTSIVQILTDLPDKFKMYVAGFFGSIIIEDGVMADSEFKTWRLITTICKFPTQDVHEAIACWRSFKNEQQHL